jgi:IclR family acetate operon transcriptional repressor
VLLANLDPEELKKRFAKVKFIQFTEKTITNLEQLIQISDQIRKDGYALDFSERDEGVTCASSPVQNAEGRVVAAISISAPAQRITEERLQKEIIPVLLGVAQSASKHMGYIPWA